MISDIILLISNEISLLFNYICSIYYYENNLKIRSLLKISTISRNFRIIRYIYIPFKKSWKSCLDSHEKRATWVRIPKNLPRGDSRGGIGRFCQVLHPSARIKERLVFGQHDNYSRPMWPSSSATFRIHFRDLRGERKSTERSSASIHP